MHALPTEGDAKTNWALPKTLPITAVPCTTEICAPVWMKNTALKADT